MFQLEPGIMIWTWVTFFVLFAVLIKVAWRPILSIVEQREKKIHDSLHKAEQAKSETQRLLEEQQIMLASSEEKIKKMLKENREIAESMKNEIIKKAKIEADKIHEETQQIIRREKEAAIFELKKQVTDLAIQAASKLIQENMDEKKHRNLVNSYIKNIDRLEKN
jgi:F-type H+-transporting ATPase subunit b